MKKFFSLFTFIFLLVSLTSCSFTDEPEALSGVAPATVDVQPSAITSEDGFVYDNQLSLSDSFNQMNYD